MEPRTARSALIVDDAHLLDRPSAEALAFAARRLLADPVFVLAAARLGEPGALLEAGLPTRLLTGLDLAGTGAAGPGARRRRPGRPRSRRLHRATGGNPLAVIELVAEPDRLRELTPGVPVPVPARDRGLVRRAGPPGSTRTPDRRCCWPPPARRPGRRGPGLRGARPRRRRRWPRPSGPALVTIRSGRVEFRHPLVRASVYAAADPGDRRAVHRALAAALPEGDVDRRAWHLAPTPRSGRTRPRPRRWRPPAAGPPAGARTRSRPPRTSGPRS